MEISRGLLVILQQGLKIKVSLYVTTIIFIQVGTVERGNGREKVWQGEGMAGRGYGRERAQRGEGAVGSGNDTNDVCE